MDMNVVTGPSEVEPGVSVSVFSKAAGTWLPGRLVGAAGEDDRLTVEYMDPSGLLCRKRCVVGDSLRVEEPCPDEDRMDLRLEIDPAASAKLILAPTVVELPDYWSRTSLSQGWVVQPIKGDELAGKLAMVSSKGAKLSACMAWRIEHPDLWQRYDAERRIVARHRGLLKKSQIPGYDASTPLLGKLDPKVNEVYLLRGAPSERVLSGLNNGLNVRATGIGKLAGLAFFENFEQVDRVATPDKCQDTLESLHERLFREVHRPPGDLYYCFLARVLCGHTLHTKDGKTDMYAKDDTGKFLPGQPIFAPASDQQELIDIPGVPLPIAFHSLVVEKEGKRKLFVCSASRTYLEYLVAYHRT